MNSVEIIEILKSHKLRITDCRIDTLGVFTESPGAYTFSELEVELNHYDRVTVYRTIHSFVDQGILHRIPDDSGSARYGLCHDTCGPGDHHHDHIHFKCQKCGTLECITGHRVPKVEIPGYHIREIDLILGGLCRKCNEEQVQVEKPKLK